MSYIMSEGDYPFLKFYDNIKLFRPRNCKELELRERHESHLRKKFEDGKYRDSSKINEIIKYQFDAINDWLNKEIEKVACLTSLDFFLNLYSTTSCLDMLNKNGKLCNEEAKQINKISSVMRRAIKYICELIVFNYKDNDIDIDLDKYEELLILSEMLVEESMISDSTYHLYPNDTVLTIYPPDCRDYIDIRPERELKLNCIKSMNIFHQFHLERGINPAPWEGMLPEICNCFNNFNIKELCGFLEEKVKLKSAPVITFDEDELVTNISKKFKVEKHISKKIIAGLNLSKENLKGRQITKPNQEYRSLKRALYSLNQGDNNIIVSSAGMLPESFVHLQKGLAFGKVPSEWLEFCNKSSLDRINVKLGKWFEDLVCRQFKEKGIVGKNYKDKIGYSSIRIPNNIGDIDFLGISKIDNILVVAECKFVDFATDPNGFRIDKDKFVDKKKSYDEKFRGKINWVIDNYCEIVKALKKDLKLDVSLQKNSKLGVVMLTHFPSIAREFIDKYECVSLAEFIDAFASNNKWPCGILTKKI